MSSASIELKNFKRLYPRLANKLLLTLGISAPHDGAALAFPVVRGVFRDNPELCKRVANGNAGMSDLEFLPPSIVSEDVEVEEWHLQELRPIFSELAQIFYANM